MKRKILIPLVVILVLSCVLGWCWLRDYSRILEANWGFALPFKALCREVYAQDTGPSFHGDGLRCHVYEYRYEDYVDLMFAWAGAERQTVFGEPCFQAAESWLDSIGVPEQWRPAYKRCFCWYKSAEDNSQILVLWDPEQNRLYILESFI